MVVLREAGGEIVLETDIPITERKRMEEDLRTRAEELVAADRSKNEFLAMLAHELRNPLAPLRNAVELVKDARTDAATLAHAREMMERQINNMSRMIEDLLDASRMSQGKIYLRRVPLDVGIVVQRSVEASRPHFEARDQDLELVLPERPIWVEGDTVRLEQVFGNLLHNASKFTRRGGHVSVTVVSLPETAGRDPAAPETEKKRQVAIHVRDDGIGIEPSMLPRVFDLFRQADRSIDRAQGGLGIGLTLVRHIVELHGGRVEVQSDGLGFGSEFVVVLPVLDAAEFMGVTRKVESPAACEAGTAPSRRILVVDDSVDGAESLALLLRLAGHDVRSSYDGPGALEAAASFRPEVVFLDIGLPGMNGYDTARQLRSRPGMEKSLLVALTGYGREDDRRRAWEAGFDHHLVKPIDFASLQDLLA
jgi:two-component system CheB/CheR fusion protein